MKRIFLTTLLSLTLLLSSCELLDTVVQITEKNVAEEVENQDMQNNNNNNNNNNINNSNHDTVTFREITVDEAVAIMASETNYIILDVRRPDEYADGHIPGAINVPNETIGTSEIPELPDKSQLILVYCRSGRRSKEAAGKLVSLGYTNIVEFGGILDWTGEIVKGN
jgi:rhodanese-related sulfurtransferase